MSSLLLKNFKVVTEKDEIITDILVVDGIIKEIGTLGCVADRVIEGNNSLAVLPALFDMHVHFRDPGQTHKEDILTGCASALAGGVTGVACMPNTNPPIDSIEIVDYILDKAKDSGVSVLPVGCITSGMKGEKLYDFTEIGVKIISDDGRPVENENLLREAMITAYKNDILVASHCEDFAIINGGIINNGEISKKLGIAGMDRSSEDSITEREISIAAETGTRIHICHVSTVRSFELVREAKKNGVNVTCETCPHYFYYTDEKVLSLDADYRMNPPLRTEEDRIATIEAILDGTCDCIVTDHAPHAASEKADFYKAPNGVVGLETSLSAMLTAFYHTGKLTLSQIVKLMSVKPRELLNLPEIKLEVGEKAEFIIVNLDEEWEVVPEKLHSKSKNTVFKGEKFKGRNILTYSDGKVRFER